MKTVRSDNATSFLSAEKELSKGVHEWNATVSAALQQRQIEWKHPAPYSSSKMGVVESLIGVVRRAWFHIGSGQVMNDEGFLTAITEVEAIVNGRPLTLTSDDPSDPQPLTPSHFLLLRGVPTLAPGVFDIRDG